MRRTTYVERYPFCKEAIEWHEQPVFEVAWTELRRIPCPREAFDIIITEALLAMAVVPNGPMQGFFNQMVTEEFFSYFCDKLLEKPR